MAKPRIHDGPAYNPRKMFFDNEELAGNTGYEIGGMSRTTGFKNDREVMDWINKPRKRPVEIGEGLPLNYIDERNAAAEFYKNGVLFPERKAAFAVDPIEPFTPEEVTKLQTTMPLGDAPKYLDMSNAMTPTQQRTRIASGALNANDPRYKDPEAVKYYRNLVFQKVKAPEDITPIETQFLQSVGMQQPKNESIGAFLSAFHNALQPLMEGVAPPYTPKRESKFAPKLPNYDRLASSSNQSSDGGGN